jgi:hypothetical protein
MSCDHEKRKKLPGLLEKTILPQKIVKNPFFIFFYFLDFQAPGADISAPNFKNS